MKASRERIARLLGGAALVAALALGFAAYRRPDVAVDLANQLWHCF